MNAEDAYNTSKQIEKLKFEAYHHAKKIIADAVKVAKFKIQFNLPLSCYNQEDWDQYRKSRLFIFDYVIECLKNEGYEAKVEGLDEGEAYISVSWFNRRCAGITFA